MTASKLTKRQDYMKFLEKVNNVLKAADKFKLKWGRDPFELLKWNEYPYKTPYRQMDVMEKKKPRGVWS